MNFNDERYFRTKDAIDTHCLGGVPVDEDIILDATFEGIPSHDLAQHIDYEDQVPFKGRTYQDENPFGFLDIERGGGRSHS